MNRTSNDSKLVTTVMSRTLVSARRAEFAYKFWTNYGVPIAFVLICIFFYIATPKFLSYENIMNVIRQRSVLAVAAVGTTIIMIGGGIDLSIGAVVGLTTCLSLKLIVALGWPAPLAVLLAIVVGVVIGFINGLLATKLGIPPLVATLGTMLVVRGAAYVFTNNTTISGHLPNWYFFIGRGYVGPLPVQVVITGIIYIIAGFLMKGTIFGIHTYAIGSNRKAARLAGIGVDRHCIVLYMIGGLTSAVAGVLLSARLGSGWAGHGTGYEFDIIAAILLGGTSIFGGKGNIFRTLIGIMLIGALTNGMNLLNVNTFYQMIATGLVLILALSLEKLRTRYRDLGS